MTTTKHMLGPYKQDDDGYVLGVVGEPKKYMFLPMADKVEVMKQVGLLPSVFPPYQIPFIDTPNGFLALMVSIFSLWALGKWLLDRNKPRGLK